MFLLLSSMSFFVLLDAFFIGVVLSSHPAVIASFACFALFYLLTLFFGVLFVASKVAADPETDIFHKPRFRLVDVPPFLAPTLFFSILVLAATFLLAPDKAESVSWFLIKREASLSRRRRRKPVLSHRVCPPSLPAMYPTPGNSKARWQGCDDSRHKRVRS